MLLSDLLNPYAIKNEFKDLIFKNYDNQLSLSNFFQTAKSEIINVEDIEVSEKPVYSLSTGLMITNLDQTSSIFNIEETDKGLNFFPSNNEVGKFIKVDVGDNQANYSLRIYVESDFNFTALQYDENTNQWVNYSIKSVNEGFKYIEIQMRGDLDIKIVTGIISLTTYNLFPIVLGISALMLVITVITLNKNRKFAKKFRSYKK